MSLTKKRTTAENDFHYFVFSSGFILLIATVFS